MRFTGAAIFAAVALLFTGAASAQKTGSAVPPPAAPGSGNTRPPISTFPNDSNVPRVIFISGTVVLSDGLPLPDRVKIQRVCGGTSHIETYTDKKGHFNFQLGQNLEIHDASSEPAFPCPFCSEYPL